MVGRRGLSARSCGIEKKKKEEEASEIEVLPLHDTGNRGKEEKKKECEKGSWMLRLKGPELLGGSKVK